MWIMAGSGGQFLQEGIQRLWQRGPQVNPGARARMRESKFCGVEEIPSQRGQRDFSHLPARSRAVERVTHDRMMQRRKVHANLVCAPGVKLNFDQCCRVDSSQQTPVCARFAGIGEHGAATRSHTRAALGVSSDGELDAALGEKVERPGLKPLFPDTVAEEESWFARHAVLPINHMVVVNQQLSNDNPDAVCEVHRLLSEAAKDVRPRIPVDHMRRSLKMIIDYTAQQGLIPRAFEVDELFDDVTRTLQFVRW